MSKFDITDWCDFVRGVAEPEAEERMREHLASGSPSARRAVTALRRVTHLGRSDHDHPIPEQALRVAKAVGSLRRPPGEAGQGTLLERLPFEITFDSQLEGAPAGTRDLQAGHRQLLFEAGEYSVEVRLEHEIEPPGTVVVGQILSRGEAGDAERLVTHGDGTARPMSDLPILILAEDRIVGRTASGAFGEFQAEGLPPESLKLCVLLKHGESLELPLDLETDPSHPHAE